MHRTDRVQVDRTDRVLLHLFEHQIHHRGQAHAMLAGTAVEPPQLDEFFMTHEAALRADDFEALGLPKPISCVGAAGLRSMSIVPEHKVNYNLHRTSHRSPARAPIQPIESLIMRGLAETLDPGALPILGPSRTGKTYTGLIQNRRADKFAKT